MIGSIWGDEDGQTRQVFWESRTSGWPGTFAILQLRRDSIAEFEALLRTCRHLAAEAQKYPAELALDFIDEIPDVDQITVVKVATFEENVEEAARVRDQVIAPKLGAGEMVVLDFQGIRFATQSFIHACIYRVLRDTVNVRSALSIANCSPSTREALMAVAAYARVADEHHQPSKDRRRPRR